MNDAMIREHIEKRFMKIKKRQSLNGAFLYNFEGPILTDCFFVIVSYTLNIINYDVINGLVERIVSSQEQDGAWKLYEDEEKGNISATIQAYTALLVSGKYNRENEVLKKAEWYITCNGGFKNAHFMTKMMLAVNGLYNYPKHFYFPMAYFLLSPKAPLNMYNCSNYARVHITPMLICLNRKYSVKHNIDTSFFEDHNNEGWFQDERVSFHELFSEIKHIAKAPFHIQQKGEKAAEDYIINRIEENGTLYSYTTATFYMIYALLSLDYSVNSSIFIEAMKGLNSYVTKTKNGYHIQNSPSEVWDTALLSYSLQEAGISINEPMIKKANDYLLKKQQTKKGDWSIHLPNVQPAGWGFSNSNTFIPDNDDTSAVLRALTRESLKNESTKQKWENGTEFLLSMQNNDGGFGAFERNAYHPLLKMIPIENAKDALVDDSTPDITGRVLEFLGNFSNIKTDSGVINKAVKYLLSSQNKDGSWYGKWGVCYIYGTWAAITGLRAVGIPKEHPSIEKAINWLVSIQNKDGGFGESCRSAEKKGYAPLHLSTLSQSAWALDALLTVQDKNSKTVQKCVNFLIENEETRIYPTGLGLPGGFYINYESYDQIFPILALGHYLKC